MLTASVLPISSPNLSPKGHAASALKQKFATDHDHRIGQRIRARRVASGISQEKLAEALGITFQQVQKYEKGTNRISASRLARVAAILGLSVNAFYDPEGVSHESAPIDDILASHNGLRLVKAYLNMPEALRSAFVAFAEKAQEVA